MEGAAVSAKKKIENWMVRVWEIYLNFI